MKKNTITKVLAAALILASVSTISSCKKYEEGPAFSLRTKKARLTGDWKISSVTIDGSDVSGTYNSNFEWDIEADGVYNMKAAPSGTGTANFSGKWKFGEDKDDVYFTDGTSGVEYACRITRLKNTELWMKNTASNGSVTYYKLKQ